MSDKDKNFENIGNEEQAINNLDEKNEPEVENKENAGNQPEVIADQKSSSEVIHKKDGRLHIYIRQDKYKGELKSKNWVGRLYINGKQKIFSSGKKNLDEAIPILENWYDDIHLEAEKAKEIETNKVIEEEKHQKKEINTEENIEVPLKELTIEKNSDLTSKKVLKLSMFDKLKNFKLGKSKKENSEESAEVSKSKSTSKNKLKSFFSNFYKSKVSKLSVAGEEIAGLDISKDAIRVCQVSQDKDENWILDKFSYRLLDKDKVQENILESKDYVAEEISLAMSNAKITSKNIALSIPVTSAIIRVVTSPLMSDEELQKAIETDSLWEN